ncbi:MAG: hypothetical protein JWM88_2259 [Verrucomicrobia bacterium]|nr:hypothetical protein [Verrucomicrobiota bacterium]
MTSFATLKFWNSAAGRFRKASPLSRPRRALALVALALAPLALPAPARAEEKPEPPTSLVLTYRIEPRNRAAFRSWLETRGARQFEAWKKTGTLKDYRILFSSYVPDSASDDVTLIVDFARFEDTAAWTKIERTMPGGLPPEALALATPQAGVLTDVLVRSENPSVDHAKAVFTIVKYGAPSADRYVQYVTDYYVPEYGRLRELGVLAGYSVYLNQNHSHATWDAIIVSEFPDLAAYQASDQAKDDAREELLKNPAWKKAAEAKAGIRRTLSSTNAEAILAPAP